jgi:hypothetical protein
MVPHPQTPTYVPLISRRLAVGFTLALATALGASTADATVAFQRDTGRPCSSCHATPGTNMRNFTGLGNCFRNAGYNIARCERVRRPPFPGPSSGTGQNCRTRTITIEEDGRTTTRRETRCD